MNKSKILFSIIFLFYSSSTLSPAEKEAPRLVLYSGKYTATGFLSILLDRQTDYKESYISVGALNLPLDGRLGSLHFETEGQIAAHSGLMRHMEFNGLMIARLPDIFHLPVSLALGEGLSYATQKPELEMEWDKIIGLKLKQDTNPLLNYLMVEIDASLPSFFSLPSEFNPRVFMRIHHRSGVFGTYCPPTCGSNFIAYGIKISL